MNVQPSSPIIVQVVQQPVESTTVADVLLGAMGLTGVMVLAAVVLGALLGGALIALKHWRTRLDDGGTGESDTIHIV
ncbi:MAG: hypothetical protein M3Q85_07775 [Acidobacteriota bacterium]|nr:hypothetical protein [Acidobacteriota bacterium]